MWVCNQCYQENTDQDAVCRGCGMQRSAGRFQTHARRSAARPADAQIPPPQPVIAQAQPIAEPVAPRKPRSDSYLPPPFDPPKYSRSALERSAFVIGFAITFLLPLLTAALAWRQYDALSQALTPLLLKDGATDIVQLIVYIALALIAVMLSSLPGLWTLLAARRPSPRGIKHTAVRK